MNVAECIAEALVAEGVRLAAGITGQSIGHLADALSQRREVSFLYTRQERVAIDIADGFARVAGSAAVVFTDAGPAAANAMGGLVNSWGDSTPVLLFAGHNDRFIMPDGETKAIPFKSLFGPVSKWVAVIDDPSQLTTIMRRAFIALRSGRAGPVVIGLPYDVSSMPLPGFAYEPVSARRVVRGAGDPASIAEAVELIAAAKRPYLYAGSGVLASEATAELVDFAALLTLPVATTLNGKSAFPENHPLALGIGGFGRALYGSLPATVLAESADLVVTIGCGFKQHAKITPFPQPFKHIQIDVDAGELHKTGLADVAILGDAKIVLRQMTDQARATLAKGRLAQVASRLAEIQALRQRWQAVSKPLLESNEAPVNPFRVIGELMKLANPDKTILLHDAGSVRGSTCQHWPATQPRSFLGFGVQSAMGWSIGAAAGAKKAAPHKLVVAVIGEEAFAETALDIETTIRCAAPILVIVKNNSAFKDRDGGGSARLAEVRFGGSADICAFATALGAKAYRVENPAKLSTALRSAIADVESGTTAVVEVLTKRVKTSLYAQWEGVTP